MLALAVLWLQRIASQELHITEQELEQRLQQVFNLLPGTLHAHLLLCSDRHSLFGWQHPGSHGDFCLGVCGAIVHAWLFTNCTVGAACWGAQVCMHQHLCLTNAVGPACRCFLAASLTLCRPSRQACQSRPQACSSPGHKHRPHRSAATAVARHLPQGKNPRAAPFLGPQCVPSSCPACRHCWVGCAVCDSMSTLRYACMSPR